MTLGLIFCHLT